MEGMIMKVEIETDEVVAQDLMWYHQNGELSDKALSAIELVIAHYCNAGDFDKFMGQTGAWDDII
jgi:hypothetical protein